MEKIDNLDKQILEIISQNARILWLQSAAFHALPFTNVCNV